MTPEPSMSPPHPSELDGLAQLRAQLQQLYDRSGAPSTRAIAGRAAQPISHTTVATVLKCLRPPRWAQLELVVQALHGDVEQFRVAWMATRSSPPPPPEKSQVEQLEAEVGRLRQERDELRIRLLRQQRSYSSSSSPSSSSPEWPDGDRHPTARRIILGNYLRRLRESKGLAAEDAGWEIRASGSKISRMELGLVPVKQRDIADLLTLYGVTDAEDREAAIAIARESQTSGWWHGFTNTLPASMEPYVALERTAALIRIFESQYVPGLLQTPDYVRAVITSQQPHLPAAEADRRVEKRLERQRTVRASAGFTLWAVIHESVLQNTVFGPAVMRQQIAALLEATEQPGVRLQIVTGHVPAPSPFTIFRFPERQLPDIVHIELITGALYLDDRDEVDEYTAALGRIQIDAESPGRCADIMREMLRQP
jgi:transcriptional regulator with XRE-family HTH domain